MAEFRINAEQLKKIDSKRQTKIAKIKENDQYVKGKNPETLNEASQGDPDNRITIPLAKMAVETLCGYAGRAGDIQVNWELLEAKEDETGQEQAQEDEYINIRRQIAEFNEAGIETSELYQTALTQGVAYELFWVTTDKQNSEVPMGVTPEYKIIPNSQGVVIYSNDIKPKEKAFLRFSQEEDKCIADIYYPKKSERWVKKEKESNWTRESKGDTIYPYTDVPVAVYPINPDELPVFEAEKDLITGNDKLLNKSVNEVDRFNALIALLPGAADKDFIEKLKKLKVMDNLDKFENWPDYLQKDLNGVGEFYKETADRLERLFHKSIKIPDFSDEDFVNAQSGLAMAYKLIGLEFVASKIETYFFKGLKQRNKLINQALKDQNIKADEYKMVLSPQRNLPIDEKAKVEIAQMLIGILSTETLLRFLPRSIVEDVQKEKARIEAEKPKGTIPGLDGEGDSQIQPEPTKENTPIERWSFDAMRLAEKVAMGELPREEAINILILFGFKKAQAEKIIPVQGSAKPVVENVNV
jgi:SPP1 family phage portal protein